MPKKPICPTDNSPAKPTTKFRLTASIAHIANTVATVMANPTPCHSMNATAQPITNRFAHSCILPFDVRQNSRGLLSSFILSLMC